MEISRINSTNFNARNITIRNADDIARKVNKCFPRVSSTLISDLPHSNKYKGLINRIDHNVALTRRESRKLFLNSNDIFEKVVSIIAPIKMNKAGNCGESAQLSAIIAKIIGIKNCYIAQLRTKNGYDLDHAVLYVDGEKPYIIDSWLGFADYVPNSIIRFKSEFVHHFDEDYIKNEEELIFKRENWFADCIINTKFSNKLIRKLCKNFPEINSNLFKKN